MEIVDFLKAPERFVKAVGGRALELRGQIWDEKVLQGPTWTSKMAKILDPILPVLSMLEWAIILGSFWRSR